MGNNNPGRYRREGRNAFYPGGVPNCPYKAGYNNANWHEGYQQAERDYVPPEPTPPTLLERLREDFTDHEINTMPRVALIEAIERLMV